MDADAPPRPPAAELALRVLVAARQPIARMGLRGLVADLPDVVVVGQAATVEDAAQLALDLLAHAVLATWDSGDADEVVALAEALSASGIPLVLLADAPAAAALPQVVRAGARAALLSDAGADDVATALRAVARGLLVLDPALARPLLATPLRIAPTLRPEEPLTEREHQVLELMALGLPNKTIAQRLAISEHTVKFHVSSILGKLDATSRTDAVAGAARRGLIPL